MSVMGTKAGADPLMRTEQAALPRSAPGNFFILIKNTLSQSFHVCLNTAHPIALPAVLC